MSSLMRPVDYMEPGRMDYSLIEPGVRELVRQLNEISFVETVSSCEGHVGDTIFKGATPDPGFTFINGGHMAFDILPSPRSEKFLGEVSELARSRGFSSFKEVGFGGESVYMVNFDTTHVGGHVSDLAGKEKIEDSDDNEERVRKSFQVETKAAGVRKGEYQDFWRELGKIARKYS
ncbi:MAG: hypothetical protein HY833_02530 [Candidatus Aenigmarchaeota archaeon]|nr:hypothetical protein [Candidatus Aenigmarchaeota archaeon]